MASEVYFTDLHVEMGDTLLRKFDRLITRAGMDNIDFQDKFVAVKLHFGEYGNLAFLRHQYAKVLCDHIKARGGKPFLTDCNTLYAGYRNNALNHLDTAYLNGYNPLSTGVQTIIADGLRGTDERLIPVEGGEFVKEAKIGSAIAEADVFISLSHFKGHCSAGFGGALKNIGMGCGSKKGKMEMHSSGTPAINTDACIGCGMCVSHCANDGVHVIDGKPAFHISLLVDVSPDCDCESTNDLPIIPDVGMFASFDPVALDQACVDAANGQPIMPGSKAERKCSCEDHVHHSGHELFHMVHPDTDWEACLDHAEKLGIGTRKYSLNNVR